jgi:mRNA-degrading endonuclease RelE of RelBE toxin-antitoxin system
MIADKLLDIDGLAKNFTNTISAELAILQDIVEKTRYALRKRYSYEQRDTDGYPLGVMWNSADLMVRVGKYHIAITESKVSITNSKKLSISLISYQKLRRGGFVGYLAAN